jgi:indolepyruvate decarboxylase
MDSITPMTVNNYIIQRLQDIGIDHVFGVPGDYVLDLLDVLTKSPLNWIGNCNELNAGYAADGYARIKGVGAAVVTYGVGGFSILNAVAGAYAEQVPLIIISGAPHSARRQANALVHHLTKDYLLQFDLYKRLTVDAVMLTNPNTAPDEIDRVLMNCISNKRPVYIEIPLDIGKMPCRAPLPISFKIERKSDSVSLNECVMEVAEMLNNAKNPVVLAGVELLRFGLSDKVLRMVEHLELPFATTVSSKSVLPEFHPQFIGLYQGMMSRPKVKHQIETSDCVVSLGVWLTDFDTGGFTAYLDEKNMINANTEQIKIKHHNYSGVLLGDFIQKLTELANPRTYLMSHPSQPYIPKGVFVPETGKKLSAARLYDRINHFLDDNMVLLAEPGDAISAAPELNIDEADNFIAQAYYLSIGYCTPASLGVSIANPKKRPVVLTGDGAFQMTAQEISTMIRNKCNTIIFLINNEGYLIERLLHEDGYYNDIQNWKYHKLPEVFGDNCICFDVNTEDELDTALKTTSLETGKLAFIEVHLPDYQCSDGLKRLGDNFRKMTGDQSKQLISTNGEKVG